MFTGIIEELGEIIKITPISGGKRFVIAADIVLSGLKPDDSIAVNGVCLTVTANDEKSFTAEAVGDTLQKTTLNSFTPSAKINLERALTLNSRLGGHLVQGHVNGLGVVDQLVRQGSGWVFKIKVPADQIKYIISEGSIAIDGISFTVAKIEKDIIHINLIPHTYQKTNISSLKPRSKVNIEVDVIGKYVEKMIGKKDAANSSVDQWLNNLGWE